MEIGVLGAGVVGMTTANELKNEFPTANVTVIADKFTTETTSDGAAGIFRPGLIFGTFGRNYKEMAERFL